MKTKTTKTTKMKTKTTKTTKTKKTKPLTPARADAPEETYRCHPPAPPAQAPKTQDNLTMGTTRSRARKTVAIAPTGADAAARHTQ